MFSSHGDFNTNRFGRVKTNVKTIFLAPNFPLQTATTINLQPTARSPRNQAGGSTTVLTLTSMDYGILKAEREHFGCTQNDPSIAQIKRRFLLLLQRTSTTPAQKMKTNKILEKQNAIIFIKNIKFGRTRKNLKWHKFDSSFRSSISFSKFMNVLHGCVFDFRHGNFS